MMELMNLTDVITHDDFIFALCTFIDEFKRNPNRYEMIKRPPQNENADTANLCMLAGTVHKLANEYGIGVPDWVYNPLFKMPYPVFAFNTKNKEYQDFLIKDTPYEFSSKNMYVGSDAIERV